MLFLNIEISKFILSFRIDDLCCVSLESEEVFGILILCKSWYYILGKSFLLKYIFELQLFSFLLISVGVCWTGVCNVK